MSHKKSFIADQRGAVALETLIVYPVLVAFLLMSLAEVAIAGLQFTSAWAALRSFGQYVQYYNPLGPDGTVTCCAGLQTTVAGYPISNIQVICGDARVACSSSNIASPKYFTFTTTVTLSPIVWRGVLCPTSCTYTLLYSERFQ
jgi:Flp pilus assembly protein TadG